MTEANVKKHYEHFCKLVNDEEYRKPFCMTITEKGKKFNSQREKLIISDAKKAKEELETKKTKSGQLAFPYLTEKVEEEKKVTKKGAK
jgi:hypothetical protein